MPEHHQWWQKGVIYQIYPRSFQDSDGNGVGDLAGILSRLDYLQWLGVDAVWLSPVYPSPMADFGYDVSDYCDIHPIFGTLAEFDHLVSELHRRSKKIILDFVPNHTSDQHPWFLESRSSRDNPKRDWYIWLDPAPDGGPPNNWLSNFGGSAWTLDERTGQYYYHAFLPQQPDLNWRNVEVRRAMHDVLRFWLDRGVDGFRVDVIWHIVKDESFRDNPRNPDYRPGQNPHHEFLATHNADQPEVHEIIAEMRHVLDAYDNRMMVGEVYLPLERLVTYYGEACGDEPEKSPGSGVHMPFNFQLIRIPWTAHDIARTVREYEAMLPSYGWPNWVLGNHDNSRIASRVGSDHARLAAMLLLTLRGTPTIYCGDEIGMHDVPIPPDRIQDPFEKNAPGMGLGRDPERTPMQWDSGPNAGFAPEGATPWLPIADNASEVNVAAQMHAPDSMLTLHRELIALRRGAPALALGDYAEVTSDERIFAYQRQFHGRRFLVALNFDAAPAALNLHVHGVRAPGVIALSTNLDRAGERVKGELTLRPIEGVVLELEPTAN